MGFVNLLKIWAKFYGLSNNKFCIKAGLARDYIRQAERATIKMPRPSTIQCVCDNLGLTKDELMAGPKAVDFINHC